MPPPRLMRRRPGRPSPNDPPPIYTTPVSSIPTPTPPPDQCWFGAGLPSPPPKHRWKRLCGTPECCNPRHYITTPFTATPTPPPPLMLETALQRPTSEWPLRFKKDCWTAFPVELLPVFWKAVYGTFPEKPRPVCKTVGCTNPLHYRAGSSCVSSSADEIEALSRVTLSLSDLLTYILNSYVSPHHLDIIVNCPRVRDFLYNHTDWRG